ncbi:MAG: DUF4169 family protein [Rhodobacteraceae bacterium]|nr:DUF4169 family protein [Paracoccaceae bacterium]
MSQPVNLNKFRKARAKVAAKTSAGENSVKFGRSAAAKALDHVAAVKRKRNLDGHKTE